MKASLVLGCAWCTGMDREVGSATRAAAEHGVGPHPGDVPARWPGAGCSWAGVGCYIKGRTRGTATLYPSGQCPVPFGSDCGGALSDRSWQRPARRYGARRVPSTQHTDARSPWPAAAEDGVAGAWAPRRRLVVEPCGAGSGDAAGPVGCRGHAAQDVEQGLGSGPVAVPGGGVEVADGSDVDELAAPRLGEGAHVLEVAEGVVGAGRDDAGEVQRRQRDGQPAGLLELLQGGVLRPQGPGQVRGGRQERPADRQVVLAGPVQGGQARRRCGPRWSPARRHPG